MAVNLSSPRDLLGVNGVELSVAAAGIKYADRDDLLLMKLASGSQVAGVFTKNKFCAAPVQVAREHLVANNVRALLINSGNANAGTGSTGYQNAIDSCASVAGVFGFNVDQVLPFSTGVIGEQLPMERVLRGIDDLGNASNKCDWESAAKAIMTTDTVPKAVSRTVELAGDAITITGIAKGSGMICPNMATLLSYVATDANISKEVLEEMLKRGTQASFNRITVDSDTSTNDALILVSTGLAGENSKIDDIDSDLGREFCAVLNEVLVELATSIIRDAEGATKFVTIQVEGGTCQRDCEQVAYSVAHSPLVKTALFASDPNWGRILMAVGKADVASLDVNIIDVQINSVALVEQGQPEAAYTEELGKGAFMQPEIEIRINLNSGDANYHVWTSDLSSEYVSINADYRS